ncbi:hypothetical protein APR04_002619 [Promicromonospora umidemergens]|nr:hypothetical protein [Promicromonospora umidemergens]
MHIDGHEVDVRYFGTREVRVRSGPHLAILYSMWLWRHGEVELLVDVAPGKVTDVYYAPPHHHLAKGSVGLVPQRGKGLAIAVGQIVLALGLAVSPLLVDLVDHLTG